MFRTEMNIPSHTAALNQTSVIARGEPSCEASTGNKNHHHVICSFCSSFPALLNYSSCNERRRLASPCGKRKPLNMLENTHINCVVERCWGVEFTGLIVKTGIPDVHFLSEMRVQGIG
jgi:hypothetical protein